MKLHWSEITEDQKFEITNGCGLGYGLLNWIIPDLYFTASCRQHDFYYKRGGWLFNKIEADVMFYAHMIKSINEVNPNVVLKTLYFIVATVYFFSVFVAGIPFWKWGRMRTLQEILKEK
jgi:hypothetical protein